MAIVFTNGCFDGLHDGHLKLLKYCKGEDNIVVVAINTDESIKKIKASTRPFNTLEKRIKDLQETGLVTEIQYFDTEKELLQLIKDTKPDILVKGKDYKDKKIVGEQEVKSWGGKVELVELLPGYSTTKLATLQKSKFLITGGLGFIGSNLIEFLNDRGINNISILDKLNNSPKWENVSGLNFNTIIDVSNLKLETLIDYNYIINLGGCSSTKEEDLNHLLKYNTYFVEHIINALNTSNTYFNNNGPKFIHASSASVYGAEEKNFTERIDNLKPLNRYGLSKLMTDKFLANAKINFPWYALRFFNVYGPKENHKIGQESIVTNLLKQYQETGMFKIFASDRKDIPTGEQKRDFIYVEDICKIIFHIILNDVKSGIYNVGTGIATSVKDILDIIHPKSFNQIITREIETPKELKKTYQYFTQADITKLRNIAGYKEPFLTLKEGIQKYQDQYKIITL